MTQYPPRECEIFTSEILAYEGANGIELDEKFVDVIVKRYISECGDEGVFVLRKMRKFLMIKCRNNLLLSAFRVIYVLANKEVHRP